MPTYQFRCPDGTIIERIYKISEVPASIPSPDGQGEAVRIISGGAGLIFKGSGFYITDYGKDGKKDQRDAAAKPSESRTDTKPATSDAKAPAATSSKTEPSSGGSTGGSASGSSGSKE